MNYSKELEEKVKRSIERIKSFEPPEGYFVAFSGGKDSVVIKALADLSGVKYDAHYNVTTVDPPELVRFIRKYHPDVIWDKPKRSMRQLIVDHMYPPTRFMRYCCAYLKEVNGGGRVVMTGTRWAESIKRRTVQGLVSIMDNNDARNIAEDSGADYKEIGNAGIVMNMDNDPTRRTVEQCYRTHRTLINPIIDWSDNDVWEFIHGSNIPYCSLYDEGWKRIGCIGCPLASAENQKKQFKRWPGMYKMYIRAFDDMIKARLAAGKETTWKTGEEVMEWWLQELTPYRPLQDQVRIDDL